MQTKQEYDDHLLKFYADTFREFALKHGLYNKNEAENFADDALKQYGSAINNGIGLEFITNLKTVSQNSSIENAINNAPTMFWKTPEGIETLKDLARSQAKEKSNDIINKITSLNPLESNDIENILKNIIRDSKKIAFKDINTSIEILKFFTIDVKNFIEYSKQEEMDAHHKNKDQRLKALDDASVKINDALYKVYSEEIDNLDRKEKIEIYSNIYHFMYTSIRELTKGSSLDNNKNSPSIIKSGRI